MLETSLNLIGLLILAATLWHSARSHRQATDVQMFLELTARFNGLTAFREQIAHDNLAKPYAKSPHMDSAIFSYFELLSNEFYLHREKILRDKLWRIWQSDIRQIVDTTMMREAWHQTVKSRYQHLGEFCQYVEGIMTVNPAFPPATAN